MNEISILSNFKNNNNIIKYYDSFVEIEKGSRNVYLCIVTEFVEDGNLL